MNPMREHVSTAPAYVASTRGWVADTVEKDVYIPSLFTLLASSVLSVVLSLLLTAATRQDSLFPRTVRRWSRTLWLLQKSSFVLVQPARNPLQPQVSGGLQQQRRARSPPGKRARGHVTGEDAVPLLSGGRHGPRGSATVVPSYQTLDSTNLHAQPVYAGNASFFRDLDRPTTWATAAPSEEDPPASVTAVASPVVAEVLRISHEVAQLESRQLVFPSHSVFLIGSACKCFLVLIYVQYHFMEVEGGWGRVCVCGAANTMAGLATPVLAYAVGFLLPIESPSSGVEGGGVAGSDPTTPPGGATAATRESDDPSDSVFIVQLLHKISHVELNDLSTVLVQGTAFVAFAAVLLPVLLAACLCGALAYAWLVAVAIALWLLAWRWYRRPRVVRVLQASDKSEQVAHGATGNGSNSSGGGTLRSSRWRAWLGTGAELVQAVAIKALALWLLHVSLQATLLLGVGLLSAGSPSWTWEGYVRNAWWVYGLQVRAPQPTAWSGMSLFKRICAVSMLAL